MTDSARFVDNQNGTILDLSTKLTWGREDSWQTNTTWVTWDEAVQYVRDLKDDLFCGFDDWRLPTRVEALGLYDPQAVNTNKYGKEIHLPDIFPPGGLSTIWIHEQFTGNEGYILDFENGEIRPLNKSKSGRMAVRAVCGETS